MTLAAVDAAARASLLSEPHHDGSELYARAGTARASGPPFACAPPVERPSA